jgi:Undecaprenyl-phosphate glucose phosphotransferase
MFDVIWIMSLSIATGISYHLAATGDAGDINEYVGVGLVVSALFCMSARAGDLYRPSHLQKPQLRKTLVTWVLVLLCLTTVAFTLKISHLFSRGATLAFFVGGMAAIITTRAGIASLLTHLLSSHSLADSRVILVTDADTNTQNTLVTSYRRYGYSVARVFEVGGGKSQSEYSSRTAATVQQVVRFARDNFLNEIIIAIPWNKTTLIDGIAKELRMLPYPATLVADPVVDRLLTRPLLEFGPARAVELLPAPLTLGQQAMKRALDLTVAAAGLVTLAPLFVLIAVAIRLDSPGPILFVQRRNGFNSRQFRIYKFRTMNTLDDGSHVQQARMIDDRITRVGRFLRRLSLDELPQLLNVVRGEMSLVGPRPHALAHDDKYTALISSYAMRQKMKPGITGLAQISGCRGETPHVGMMQRRVEFDLRYIENWSLRLDLKIIAMTAVHVFRSRQAY